MAKSSSGNGGCGCLSLFLVLCVVGWCMRLVSENPGETGAVLVVTTGLAIGGWLMYRSHSQRKAAEAERQARDAWEARRASLTARFGPEAAEAILAKRVWQGQTAEMVVEALGHPADVAETVMKTKTKHVYKYHQIAANRFGFHVFLENGVVVGWANKG